MDLCRRRLIRREYENLMIFDNISIIYLLFFKIIYLLFIYLFIIYYVFIITYYLVIIYLFFIYSVFIYLLFIYFIYYWGRCTNIPWLSTRNCQHVTVNTWLSARDCQHVTVNTCDLSRWGSWEARQRRAEGVDGHVLTVTCWQLGVDSYVLTVTE